MEFKKEFKSTLSCFLSSLLTRLVIIASWFNSQFRHKYSTVCSLYLSSLVALMFSIESNSQLKSWGGRWRWDDGKKKEGEEWERIEERILTTIFFLLSFTSPLFFFLLLERCTVHRVSPARSIHSPTAICAATSSLRRILPSHWMY